MFCQIQTYVNITNQLSLKYKMVANDCHNDGWEVSKGRIYVEQGPTHYKGALERTHIALPVTTSLQSSLW